MANVVSAIAGVLNQIEVSPEMKDAAQALNQLVSEESYIGEVYSLRYEDSLV